MSFGKFGTTIDMETLRAPFSIGTPTAITSFTGKILYYLNGASYSVPAIGIGNPFSFSYFQNAIHNGTAYFGNLVWQGSGTNTSSINNINFGITNVGGTLTSTLDVYIYLSATVGYRNLKPTLRLERNIATGIPGYGKIEIYKNNVLVQTITQNINFVGYGLYYASNLNFENGDHITIILTNGCPGGCAIVSSVTFPIANGV